MIAGTYDQLLELLRQTRPRLIGIEGFQLSGKTTAGARLAREMPGVHLDTDNFEDGKVAQTDPRGASFDLPYVQHRDFKSLKSRLCSESGLVIVSGICLRDTLKKIEFDAGFYVYMKCLSMPRRMWDDGQELEEFEGLEEEARRGYPALKYSELEYHCRARPHERADFIVEREEVEEPSSVQVD